MSVASNSGELVAFSIPLEGQAGLSDLLASWRTELGQHDPRSYEYRELALVIADLASEAGLPVELEPRHEDVPQLPPGFVGSCALGEVVVLSEQFAVTVPMLHRAADEYVVSDGTELITDSGKHVRLVDMRPKIAARLSDIGPDSDDAARLETHFYHDLRQLVDTGTASNVVHRNCGKGTGPCYTRVMGMKARAYWGPIRVVEHDNEHVLTVARFADCGNSETKEAAMYRRLLGIRTRKPTKHR